MRRCRWVSSRARPKNRAMRQSRSCGDDLEDDESGRACQRDLVGVPERLTTRDQERNAQFSGIDRHATTSLRSETSTSHCFTPKLGTLSTLAACTSCTTRRRLDLESERTSNVSSLALSWASALRPWFAVWLRKLRPVFNDCGTVWMEIFPRHLYEDEATANGAEARTICSLVPCESSRLVTGYALFTVITSPARPNRLYSCFCILLCLCRYGAYYDRLSSRCSTTIMYSILSFNRHCIYSHM